MRIVTSLVVGLLLGPGVACGGDPVSPQAETLDEAQALWMRAKPTSGSYAFDQQVACFCPYGASTYRVTVTAGNITRVHDPQTVTDLPAGQFSRFRTVDKLFEEVRSAISNAGVLTAVEYHPTMGFPTKVSLDPIKNAVDDEVAYFTGRLALTP